MGKRELKSLIILIVSVIVFILLLPFTIVVAILKILTGILKVTGDTITYFMESVHREIMKQ
jgi:uncharacterized RDD family membrane protein YckC